MARSAPSFSSFAAGEISPLLEGRTGIDKYREGLADLTNMVVMPQGGVKRRPGTEFLGEVKNSSVKTRLIPFQFKTSDTYILEFGNSIMRVYRNGAQVLNATAKTITAITKASPGVLTSNSHGFSNGDEVYIVSVGGITIAPGDIIVGDRDGVVVVPKAAAADVAKALTLIEKEERKTEAKVLAGKLKRLWDPTKFADRGIDYRD